MARSKCMVVDRYYIKKAYTDSVHIAIFCSYKIDFLEHIDLLSRSYQPSQVPVPLILQPFPSHPSTPEYPNPHLTNYVTPQSANCVTLSCCFFRLSPLVWLSDWPALRCCFHWGTPSRPLAVSVPVSHC